MRFKNGEKEPFEETVKKNAKPGEGMLDELSEVESMTRYIGATEGLGLIYSLMNRN